MNTNAAEIPADASDDDLKAMGLPPRFTFDDLKGSFEDEEIAQMADDGLVDLPEDFKRPPTKESAADTIARQNDPDGEGDEDPEGDDDEEGKDATEEGDKEGADDGTQEAPDTDPTIDLKDTSDAQKVLDGFDDELATLHDDYDDGEITAQELRDKIKELNAAQVKAQRELDEAERHNQNQMQTYQDTWYSKTQTFMEDTPELGDKNPIPGFDGKTSAIQVFDQALRHVTGTEAFAGMTMDQKIAAAADIADAYVEQKTGKKLRADPDPEDKGKNKGKGKADNDQDGPKQGKRPEPPTTLANVTAATDNEIEDGRFAAIDRATGLEAEEMLSRMSKAEQEAYLRGV